MSSFWYAEMIPLEGHVPDWLLVTGVHCCKLSLIFYRSFLIEEKCRFLSNFSLQTAEVELPGEFLLPKVNPF
jgi:hypothetical protein